VKTACVQLVEDAKLPSVRRLPSSAEELANLLLEADLRMPVVKRDWSCLDAPALVGFVGSSIVKVMGQESCFAAVVMTFYSARVEALVEALCAVR